MPTLLVIRLHPDKSVSEQTFRNGYLPNLSIAAHELSFADPSGSGPAFGTAAYLPPTLSPSPSPNPAPQHHPNTWITQHFAFDLERRMFSMESAAIKVPDPLTGDSPSRATQSATRIKRKSKQYSKHNRTFSR